MNLLSEYSEYLQMDKFSEGVKQDVDAECEEKKCNCSWLVREVAAENLQLRNEVEDQKWKILRLKNEKKKDKEELRKKDRKEAMFLVVALVSIVMCCMFAISSSMV